MSIEMCQGFFVLSIFRVFVMKNVDVSLDQAVHRNAADGLFTLPSAIPPEFQPHPGQIAGRAFGRVVLL
jgi:hypothetical protein